MIIEYVKFSDKIIKIAEEFFDKIEEISNTKKLVQFRLRSNDRIENKEKFLIKLQSKGYSFIEKSNSVSSVAPLETKHNNVTYRFIFKPFSGGMSETTLNSTITELIPTIMFNDKIYDDDIHILYNKISISNISYIGFVNEADFKAGKKFIEEMPNSSKFEDKMDNAIAIYDYTTTLNSTQKIDKIFWAYRAKPKGVPKNSPADIVISFDDGKYLGVSLKAGGKNTREPLLNTYMKPICEFFDVDMDKIENDLYGLSYKHIGLPENYRTFIETFTVLETFETNYFNRYNEYYNINLKYLKVVLMKIFSSNEERFLQFVKEKILKCDDNIPLVIIKAFGRKCKTVDDDNELLSILPFIKYMEVEDSITSKQNFYVNLYTEEKEYKLMFSIRSNKVGCRHKLGQFFNLAVKYNGLK